MASLIVCHSNDRELSHRLCAFVRELRGEIDHVIAHTDHIEAHVGVADANLQLLLARLRTSGGFRWRR